MRALRSRVTRVLDWATGQLDHLRVPLLLLAALTLGRSGWSTFDRVEVRWTDGDIACGSPIDPVAHGRVLAPRTDALGELAALVCGPRLDRIRSQRSQDLALTVVLGGLALAGTTRQRRPRDETSEPSPFALPEVGEPMGALVQLRRARPTDVRSFLATVDEEVEAVNGWRPEHLPGAAFLIAQDQPRWGQHHDLLVVERSTGKVVGCVGASATDGPVVRLGWWIGPDHRRRGFATDAVRTAGEGYAAAGRVLIEFATAEENRAIRAIAARLGATEVGRGPHPLPDGSHPTAITYRWRVAPDPERATD